MLEAWTLSDQRNAAFTPPGLPAPAVGKPVPVQPVPVQPAATPAETMMRTAFISAVNQLSSLLGGGPGRWQWGKLHTRQFPSLTAAHALGYGPRSASGDIWTVDAAEGGMNSEIGPSWRMIAWWSGVGQPVAEAIYPGGQSENPASPWYANLIGDWWTDSYLPMPAAGGPAATTVARSAGTTAGAAAGGAAGAAAGGVAGSGRMTFWELRP